MIKTKIEEALNQQLNLEFYSSYLYLSMSAYFDSKHLSGFANWAIQQSEEEKLHAMKIYSFLLERGANVVLSSIQAPPACWDSPLNAFEDSFANEQRVTNTINNLVDLAVEEKDHATHIFMQWFVTEQVEEESMTSGIVERLKMISGSDGNVLFLMDHELGQRKEVEL